MSKTYSAKRRKPNIIYWQRQYKYQKRIVLLKLYIWKTILHAGANRVGRRHSKLNNLIRSEVGEDVGIIFADPCFQDLEEIILEKYILNIICSALWPAQLHHQVG